MRGARTHGCTAVAPPLRGDADRRLAAKSPAEHIYIGSEDTSTNPAAAARTLRETVVLRNPLRHTGAELALFDEGFLKVTELRTEATPTSHSSSICVSSIRCRSSSA